MGVAMNNDKIVLENIMRRYEMKWHYTPTIEEMVSQLSYDNLDVTDEEAAIIWGLADEYGY